MCSATATKTNNVCRWIVRPSLTSTGWGRAVLAINGTPYRAECMFCPDGDTGLIHQVIDLRKMDGTHYRVIFDPSGDVSCDCQSATYRDGPCKHGRAVRASLDWLVRLEAAEFEVGCVRQSVCEGFSIDEAA